MRFIPALLAVVTVAASLSAADRPNILFAIADDMSARHAGCYGDPVVSTPAMDRVAREGVRFSQAFCATPSCTPSRGTVLTGQAMWRLGEGGLLMGALPAELPTYPAILGGAGYFVGHTGKGWGPGNLKAGGRTENPAGRAWNRIRNRNVPGFDQGPFNYDYAANFEQFLADRPGDQPFCFWYGAIEPHLPWPKGAGREAGLDPAKALVPDSLPDHPIVRDEMLDNYIEIQHFDSHLGRMLAALEKAGELDNTIVIVTSDHGTPLPRCKANLYDAGTHIPLVVRWPGTIPGGRVVDDLVSLTDVAPTILEAAGVAGLPDATGRSLMPILTSGRSGRVDPTRNAVFTAFERHTWCRPGGVGYPMRAVRTERFLYIRNYETKRWPAGDPDFKSPHQGYIGDSDACLTKDLLIDKRYDPTIEPYWQLAFGRRPAEELYDVRRDPDQLVNLAEDPAFTHVLGTLRAQLAAHQTATDDPRIRGEAPWDTYPYYIMGYQTRARPGLSPLAR